MQLNLPVSIVYLHILRMKIFCGVLHTYLQLHLGGDALRFIRSHQSLADTSIVYTTWLWCWCCCWKFSSSCRRLDGCSCWWFCIDLWDDDRFSAIFIFHRHQFRLYAAGFVDGSFLNGMRFFCNLQNIRWRRRRRCWWGPNGVRCLCFHNCVTFFTLLPCVLHFFVFIPFV